MAYARKRRYFRASLGKPKNIVDKKQHVLAFDIAEIFGESKRSEAHALACSGRLVHLAKDEHGFIEHAAFGHFEIKIISFAGTLPYPPNTE